MWGFVSPLLDPNPNPNPNPNPTLTKVWGFVSPLLDPRTASKFVIMGGPSEFLPRLQEHLDIDDLPEFLGGKDTSCDFVREVGPWAEYVPALK